MSKWRSCLLYRQQWDPVIKQREKKKLHIKTSKNQGREAKREGERSNLCFGDKGARAGSNLAELALSTIIISYSRSLEARFCLFTEHIEIYIYKLSSKLR